MSWSQVNLYRTSKGKAGRASEQQAAEEEEDEDDFGGDEEEDEEALRLDELLDDLDLDDALAPPDVDPADEGQAAVLPGAQAGGGPGFGGGAFEGFGFTFGTKP